jgi:tetratricopeptide (TPR) repeat protein
VSRELVLSGLSPAEGRELAGLIGGSGAQADEAEGHPLFIHELIRYQAENGGAVSRLEDALAARISRLEEASLRVLEATTVAGAPVAQSAIAFAAELEPASCAKRVAQLRAATLVRTTGLRGGDSIEPYHDRVRQAVLNRLPPARRRTYHQRLADALEAAGGARRDPLTLVRHLVAAGASERAAELARRAGQMAEETLAFDQAAELYRMALFLGGAGPGEGRELALRHAEALANAGRGPEAAEAFLAAAVHATADDDRFHCRHRAAEQFLVSGHIDRGMATLGSVLAEVGVRMPQNAAAVRRSLIGSWIKLAVRGRRWKVRPPTEVPAREMMRLDVYRSISLGLAMVDSALGADFQARALRLALQVGEPRRVCHALAFHALYQGSRGGRRLKAAGASLAEAKQIAATSNDPWLSAWTRSAEGILAYFAGQFGAATRHLGEAQAQFRDQTTGTTSELAHVRVFELLALRRIGDFHALAGAYRDYVRDAARRGDRYAETTFIRSANLLWLAADDVETARAELARARWSPPEGGFHLQHWFEARAQVDLALYEGASLDEATAASLRAFRGTPFMRLQVLRGENDWMAARLALVNGQAAEARRLVGRLRGERIGYIDVWADLVAGGLGDPRGFEQAARKAELGDMPLFAAVARWRAGERLGGEVGRALMDVSKARLEALGVRRVEAMARTIAPTVEG